MQPTGRALTLAGAGFVLAMLPAAVSLSLWPWLGFWAVFFFLLLLDSVFAFGVRFSVAELEAPELVYIGTQEQLNLALKVPRRRSLALEIHVDAEGDVTLERRRAGRLTDGEARFEIPFSPTRRGQLVFSGVWLRYKGPLGLVDRRLFAPFQVNVKVVPNITLVRGAALAFFNRHSGAGPKIERYLGDGTEFDSLKEFSAGMDSRSVDWKASARHASLLARHFRAERNHQIVIALDTGRLMREPLNGIPRLDHAIHAALALAYVSLRLGDQVGLYAFDERPRAFLRPMQGIRSFHPLAAKTAELGYSLKETNFTVGLGTLSARLNRRSLVIVLTDFVDSVSAELMLHNLGRLAQRHLTLFVCLQDPLLRRLRAQEPTSWDLVNQSVLADCLKSERDVVLGRLRGFGISALDSTPDQLNASLINRYLEIKRRELIA